MFYLAVAAHQKELGAYKRNTETNTESNVLKILFSTYMTRRPLSTGIFSASIESYMCLITVLSYSYFSYLTIFRNSQIVDGDR